LQIESIPAVPGDLRVETRKSYLTAGEASHLRVAGTVHEHRQACSNRCGAQQVRVVITIDHTLTQGTAGWEAGPVMRLRDACDAAAASVPVWKGRCRGADSVLQ